MTIEYYLPLVMNREWTLQLVEMSRVSNTSPYWMFVDTYGNFSGRFYNFWKLGIVSQLFFFFLDSLYDLLVIVDNDMYLNNLI